MIDEGMPAPGVWTVRANSSAYTREIMQELKDGTQDLVEGRAMGKTIFAE
jgi:hypothetical protein